MIYLDTNVMVAYVNPRDKLHGRAEHLLTKYRESEKITSQLAVVELYSVFSRVVGVSDPELEALVNYTIRRCGARVVLVDWDELYSQSLRYANKLKLRTLDLLHVVAAYLLGAKTMISFDKDINSKGELIRSSLGINVVGL